MLIVNPNLALAHVAPALVVAPLDAFDALVGLAGSDLTLVLAHALFSFLFSFCSLLFALCSLLSALCHHDFYPGCPAACTPLSLVIVPVAPWPGSQQFER